MTLTIAVVILLAVTLLFTLFIRAKDIPPPDPVSPTQHLDERKARLYENLRDLQFEYRLGKLSDEDYAKTKLSLQKELAGVVAEIEKVQPKPVAAAGKKGAAMKGLAALFVIALPLFAVDGTVVNATTGQPQFGVAINLVQPSQNGMVQLGNATSDAQGQFKIDKQIPPGPGLLQATYEGTTYNQIITPGMATTGVQLKIYDSTKKAGIARTMEHLILLEPGADRLRVSETFVLGNDSNLTYNDPAKGSIQFFLPPATNGNAQVIITAPGGMPIPRPALKTATAGIYKVDYPVKPGETRMDVSYTVPAATKFSGKVVASDAATHLVTPGTVTVTGDGIELAGREPQTQANIYNLTGLDYNLLIDGIGSLRQDDSAEAAGQGAQGDDGGSPQVEIKKPRIYAQLPWVLSLAFAILALGGTMLYRRGAA